MRQRIDTNGDLELRTPSDMHRGHAYVPSPYGARACNAESPEFLIVEAALPRRLDGGWEGRGAWDGATLVVCVPCVWAGQIAAA